MIFHQNNKKFITWNFYLVSWEEIKEGQKQFQIDWMEMFVINVDILGRNERNY